MIAIPYTYFLLLCDNTILPFRPKSKSESQDFEVSWKNKFQLSWKVSGKSFKWVEFQNLKSPPGLLVFCRHLVFSALHAWHVVSNNTTTFPYSHDRAVYTRHTWPSYMKFCSLHALTVDCYKGGIKQWCCPSASLSAVLGSNKLQVTSLQ